MTYDPTHASCRDHGPSVSIMLRPQHDVTEGAGSFCSVFYRTPHPSNCTVGCALPNVPGSKLIIWEIFAWRKVKITSALLGEMEPSPDSGTFVDRVVRGTRETWYSAPYTGNHHLPTCKRVMPEAFRWGWDCSPKDDDKST